MISESIGFAVKKLVSVPNGLAIHRLEDLFDSYYIFIALRHAKGKISPDDFQVIFHSFTLQTVFQCIKRLQLLACKFLATIIFQTRFFEFP